ncbi:MAG: DNA-3-methyladenine glycosylase [Flavobacteriales bacterium]|nr:DNA-3-methyladenine glycosylase [Flavobacteriales bacterium]
MIFLTPEFYQRTDVLQIAAELIGKYLVLNTDGQAKKCLIVETEAYNGVGDKASHAYKGRRTRRTETMYLKGGHAYVYLCYGVHHLFNVVTSVEDDPKAVLIRALSTPDDEPKFHPASGPGKLARYLGINAAFDATSLTDGALRLAQGMELSADQIAATPRIGVDYAQEDALLPYRFIWKEHPALSGPRGINRNLRSITEIVPRFS